MDYENQGSLDTLNVTYALWLLTPKHWQTNITIRITLPLNVPIVSSFLTIHALYRGISTLTWNSNFHVDPVAGVFPLRVILLTTASSIEDIPATNVIIS